MAYVKRPAKSDAVGSPEVAPADPSFVHEYPALWEYLTMAKWEDGRPRETSTMLILVEEGMFKICLNDRALERSCWMACKSLTAGLATLEEALATDGAEWRRRAPGGPRGKR